jgi:hypothetical protein
MMRLPYLLSLFSLVPAFAQDTPPPPIPPLPPMSSFGPSLAETMKFIVEKLGSIGPVNYISYGHDNVSGRDLTPNKWSYEMTNVRIDAAGCRIDFRRREMINGGVPQEVNAGISLKNVRQVVVATAEQELNAANARAGSPNVTAHVDPPVFMVFAWIDPSKYTGAVFRLYDEPLANRMANALTHAVELCGGGNKDPF